MDAHASGRDPLRDPIGHSEKTSDESGEAARHHRYSGQYSVMGASCSGTTLFLMHHVGPGCLVATHATPMGRGEPSSWDLPGKHEICLGSFSR
jgi:hypothetical protein